jgi:hypothetical protein
VTALFAILGGICLKIFETQLQQQDNTWNPFGFLYTVFFNGDEHGLSYLVLAYMADVLGVLWGCSLCTLVYIESRS